LILRELPAFEVLSMVSSAIPEKNGTFIFFVGRLTPEQSHVLHGKVKADRLADL
jgi:hypothetical protein